MTPYVNQALSFFVPGEPRGKGRPRFVRATGRTYTDTPTASYENLIRVVAMEALGAADRFDGAVSVVLTAYLGVPASASRKTKAAMLAHDILPTKKPDLDNVAKAAMDALNTVVFRDDAQVTSIVAHKLYGEKPGLRIIVAPYHRAVEQAVAA